MGHDFDRCTTSSQAYLMRMRLRITVAEKGRAFYFHNFQKRSFPTMVISDYEYFSLLKFLDTGFSHPDMKALGAGPSKKRRGSLVLDARLSST